MNTFFNKNIISIYVALLAMLLSFGLKAEISVIVSSSSAVSSADMKTVKKVFLGKKQTVGGVDVVAGDQEEGSAVRDDFYMKVAKKNAAKLKNYWSKMIFSGKAIPPDVIGDDAAMIAWVASKKNRIGYVDSSAVNSSVKVVLKVP